MEKNREIGRRASVLRSAIGIRKMTKMHLDECHPAPYESPSASFRRFAGRRRRHSEKLQLSAMMGFDTKLDDWEDFSPSIVRVFLDS